MVPVESFSSPKSNRLGMEIVEAKKYGSQTSNSKWDNFDKDEYLNSKVAFNEGLFAYPCQLRNI